MTNNYRVKYKNGDFEVEIESSDKGYVDSKLAELIAAEVVSSTSPSASSKKQKSLIKKRAVKATNTEESDIAEHSKVDIAKLVGHINDADNHDDIAKHILGKSAQLPKILMCLYFAMENLESPNLTTGNIETITDQLGIKMKCANAVTTIKKNQKYFAQDTVRKMGAIMKYKLNRKGKDAYLKVVTGDKI